VIAGAASITGRAPDLRQASAGITWLLVAEEREHTQVKLVKCAGGSVGQPAAMW
jgi:hypothetical protein